MDATKGDGKKTRSAGQGGNGAIAPRGTDQAGASPARRSPRDDIFYRALAPCRVGSFREPGEVFNWPRFEVCPAYLEEAKPGPAKAAPARAAATAAAGPTAADLFAIR